MWSAIPVALPYMIVKVRGSRAAAPKGTGSVEHSSVRPSTRPSSEALSGLKSALSGPKSCRTQGTVHLSILSIVHLSPQALLCLKSALSRVYLFASASGT